MISADSVLSLQLAYTQQESHSLSRCTCVCTVILATYTFTLSLCSLQYTCSCMWSTACNWILLDRVSHSYFQSSELHSSSFQCPPESRTPCETHVSCCTTVQTSLALVRLICTRVDTCNYIVCCSVGSLCI